MEASGARKSKFLQFLISRTLKRVCFEEIDPQADLINDI